MPLDLEPKPLSSQIPSWLWVGIYTVAVRFKGTGELVSSAADSLEQTGELGVAVQPVESGINLQEDEIVRSILESALERV
ncbi:MAG: hypothetical protein AABN34_18835 [Acidobacteriota bacterium]